jgi:hypothetical protein
MASINSNVNNYDYVFKNLKKTHAIQFVVQLIKEECKHQNTALSELITHRHVKYASCDNRIQKHKKELIVKRVTNVKKSFISLKILDLIAKHNLIVDDHTISDIITIKSLESFASILKIDDLLKNIHYEPVVSCCHKNCVRK